MSHEPADQDRQISFNAWPIKELSLALDHPIGQRRNDQAQHTDSEEEEDEKEDEEVDEDDFV